MAAPGIVDEADVYKGEVLAATLRRTPHGVAFQYVPSYLAAALPPVATTLPLDSAPLLQPGGGVPPFFAGLLPEGRRLTSLRRSIKTSADDDLSLLAAVGADTIGDVRVLPKGMPPTLPAAAVEIKRRWNEVSFTEVLERAGVVDAVALPGVQDKVSLRMLSLPVTADGRDFILKLNPPEYPQVVENEHYFLGVARRGRIPAARARVVHDRGGRPGLLVVRFDRAIAPDGGVIRRPMEDATQVLGMLPADKYNVTTERVVHALAGLCPARAVALRDLFRQTVFAWLTGNGDQHAKNLSVLATDGEWRVAPMYDVPSTVPYGDTRAALSIDSHKDGFSRKRMEAFGTSIGLPITTVMSVIDQTFRATAGVVADVEAGALPFDAAATRDLVRVLQFRRRAMA